MRILGVPRSLGLFVGLFLVLLGLGAAQPLQAALYVPYAANATVRGLTLTTQIRVHNDSDATATLTYLFVAQGTSSVGIDRETAPIAVSVAPHATVGFGNWVPAGQVGWLEIAAGPEIAITARLSGTPATGTKGFGAEIPVVTSDRAVAAGETALLPGLASKTGQKVTDAVLINLATDPAVCAVEVFKSSGSREQVQEIDLPGLIASPLADLLAAAGIPESNDATAAVTCDQTAYSFALVHQLKTSQIFFVDPAGRGEPPPDACPASSICLEKPGLVHQPTPAKPVGRVTFDAPVGTFRRITLSLDVTVGGWFDDDPDGKHLIFWFVINKNLDMLGMLYFRGPEAYTALVRHGIGLPHADKIKIVDKDFQAQNGHTYHVVNDYDMGANQYTVTIIDKADGKVKSTIRGVPNVDSVTLGAADNLVIDMAFPEGGVDEVPAYGWQFRDILIELAQ